MSEDSSVCIGVLAIQGAVEEHQQCLERINCRTKQIRVPEDMVGVDGIILPGGESTAMSIVGESCGLFPALKEWVAQSKPVWGTCAGMILLSHHALLQARSGQTLIGGLNVEVCRNYFGSQIHSCELNLEVDSSAFISLSDEDVKNGTIDKTEEAQNSKKDNSCSAIFIRAPAILKVGKDVKVLASVEAPPHPSALEQVKAAFHADDSNDNSVESKRQKIEMHSLPQKVCAESDQSSYTIAVAVQQENIIATAFHPELTEDLRWHRIFRNIVLLHKAKTNSK